MERKTTLYDTHVKYGGKMVPFAGYLLPVQYKTGVIKEHMAVRTGCGLFDVSHMGEITCQGADAEANLNRILTNHYCNMSAGRARYSPMCNEHGGVVDDLIVHKLGENNYFIVVNAANKENDFQWMLDHAEGRCVFSDISDYIGDIAIQGPLAFSVLSKIAEEKDIPEKYYTFTDEVYAAGIKCMIARTGYTGEDGFEIYMPAEKAPEMWEVLMKAGEIDGLMPCGLGARDTLRLEAAMPLYGHEMDDDITPLEAGLEFAVGLDKKTDFIGKQALLEKGEPQITRVGLEVTGRGILRENQDIFIGTEKVGRTTSGTHAPYLKKAIAMAMINKDSAAAGTEVEVDVRGRRVEARITALPFYKRNK